MDNVYKDTLENDLHVVESSDQILNSLKRHHRKYFPNECFIYSNISHVIELFRNNEPISGGISNDCNLYVNMKNGDWHMLYRNSNATNDDFVSYTVEQTPLTTLEKKKMYDYFVLLPCIKGIYEENVFFMITRNWM